MSEQISVALCTYNGVRFIAEQLDSILSQTVLPAQIVISDDGSSDGTIEFIEQFWAESIHNKPILNSVELKILRNQNSLGVTKNFEQALKACTQPLIALCDQDDVWVATKLEQLSELFTENKRLLLVFTDSRLVNAQGQPLGHTSFDALRVSPTERTSFEKQQGSQVFLKRNLATGATMMLRRQLLDVATPFPTEWVHDEWLALIASFAGDVRLYDECLIDYRQHGSNQIGMKKPGIKHYIGRLIFPRTERNFRLYRRALQMSEHPFFQQANTDAYLAARGKLEHETARRQLPASRINRIKPIVREMRTGRYKKFGLGSQDIARDLIQPA